MYHLFWFLHIFGIVLWFGSLLTVGFLLMTMRRKPESEKFHILPSVVRGVTRLSHIGAAFLLIGGIPMLFMIRHTKMAEFWVQYMAGLGIIIVLLSMFMLSAVSKDMVGTADGAMVRRSLRLYGRWLSFILLLTLSILVVVAFKI